jgi:hypothetical protein
MTPMIRGRKDGGCHRDDRKLKSGFEDKGDGTIELIGKVGTADGLQDPKNLHKTPPTPSLATLASRQQPSATATSCGVMVKAEGRGVGCGRPRFLGENIFSRKSYMYGVLN